MLSGAIDDGGERISGYANPAETLKTTIDLVRLDSSKARTRSSGKYQVRKLVRRWA